MKTELKKISIYAVIIILIIISFIADGCERVKDAFAAEAEESFYLPMVSNEYRPPTNVYGALVDAVLMIPKSDAIVRLAEVFCDETTTEELLSGEPVYSGSVSIKSAPDGAACIFVLDIVFSPKGVSGEDGRFLVPGVPYARHGYVPLVMEGEPPWYPVYVLLDDAGNILVLDLYGGEYDLGAFFINFEQPLLSRLKSIEEGTVTHDR